MPLGLKNTSTSYFTSLKSLRSEQTVRYMMARE